MKLKLNNLALALSIFAISLPTVNALADEPSPSPSLESTASPSPSLPDSSAQLGAPSDPQSGSQPNAQPSVQPSSNSDGKESDGKETDDASVEPEASPKDDTQNDDNLKEKAKDKSEIVLKEEDAPKVSHEKTLEQKIQDVKLTQQQVDLLTEYFGISSVDARSMAQLLVFEFGLDINKSEDLTKEKLDKLLSQNTQQSKSKEKLLKELNKLLDEASAINEPLLAKDPMVLSLLSSDKDGYGFVTQTPEWLVKETTTVVSTLVKEPEVKEPEKPSSDVTPEKESNTEISKDEKSDVQGDEGSKDDQVAPVTSEDPSKETPETKTNTEVEKPVSTNTETSPTLEKETPKGEEEQNPKGEKTVPPTQPEGVVPPVTQPASEVDNKGADEGEGKGKGEEELEKQTLPSGGSEPGVSEGSGVPSGEGSGTVPGENGKVTTPGNPEVAAQTLPNKEVEGPAGVESTGVETAGVGASNGVGTGVKAKDGQQEALKEKEEEKDKDKEKDPKTDPPQSQPAGASGNVSPSSPQPVLEDDDDEEDEEEEEESEVPPNSSPGKQAPATVPEGAEELGESEDPEGDGAQPRSASESDLQSATLNLRADEEGDKAEDKESKNEKSTADEKTKALETLKEEIAKTQLEYLKESQNSTKVLDTFYSLQSSYLDTLESFASIENSQRLLEKARGFSESGLFVDVGTNSVTSDTVNLTLPFLTLGANYKVNDYLTVGGYATVAKLANKFDLGIQRTGKTATFGVFASTKVDSLYLALSYARTLNRYDESLKLLTLPKELNGYSLTGIKGQKPTLDTFAALVSYDVKASDNLTLTPSFALSHTNYQGKDAAFQVVSTDSSTDSNTNGSTNSSTVKDLAKINYSNTKVLDSTFGLDAKYQATKRLSFTAGLRLGYIEQQGANSTTFGTKYDFNTLGVAVEKLYTFAYGAKLSSEYRIDRRHNFNFDLNYTRISKLKVNNFSAKLAYTFTF